MGLRRNFNKKVFEALQKSFLQITSDFEGFNELAWRELDNSNPTKTDRTLLAEVLEKINSAHHQGNN